MSMADTMFSLAFFVNMDSQFYDIVYNRVRSDLYIQYVRYSLVLQPKLYVVLRNLISVHIK